MIGYRVKKQDNKWYFEFIPHNNKNQPIGRSILFSSEAECHNAVTLLQRTLKNQRVGMKNNEVTAICQVEKGWIAQYYLNNEIIYQSRIYEAKQGCKKSISSFRQKIDEYASYLPDERT